MSILPFRRKVKHDRDEIDALTDRLAKDRGFSDPEQSRPAWRFLVMAIVLIALAFFSDEPFNIAVSVTWAGVCVACSFSPAWREFRLTNEVR